MIIAIELRESLMSKNCVGVETIHLSVLEATDFFNKFKEHYKGKIVHEYGDYALIMYLESVGLKQNE